MTIGERILLIIEERHMKKVDFAKKLEVDQSHITKITKNQSTASIRLINDICRVFSVRKEWLLNGEGNMYQPKISDLLDEFEVDEIDRKIIISYLKMSPEKRKFIKEWIRDLASTICCEETKPQKFEDMSVEDQLQSLKPQLEAQKKTGKLLASTTTNISSSQKNKT